LVLNGFSYVWGCCYDNLILVLHIICYSCRWQFDDNFFQEGCRKSKKYIEPFVKQNCKYKFNQNGDIGNKIIIDNEIVKLFQKSKLCPIIHDPLWQVEKGLQDLFYTVFLCGRFGICDNLGAVTIFGDEIKDICEINQKKYFDKSSYYLKNIKEQEKYIRYIQKKIKSKYNFYIQWYNILCGKYNF